ncbi:MAG: hypothetical protein AAFU85_13025 [Planctomycetota bacterium]
MRRFQLLTLLLCGLLAGCAETDSTSTVTSVDASSSKNSPAIDLNPATLEKLSSWDETSRASAELTKQLAAIMAEIQDTESASAAIEKLRDLAPKFAAVNRAEKAFGEPSKEDRTLVLKNLADAHKAFDAAYSPLIENEELKAIVGQAIDDAYVGNVTE